MKSIITYLLPLMVTFSLFNFTVATTGQSRYNHQVMLNDTVITLYPPPVPLQEVKNYNGRKVNIEEKVQGYEVISEDLKILKIEGKDHLRLNIIIRGSAIKLNVNELKHKIIFVYGIVSINKGIPEIEVADPQYIFVINHLKKE